MATCEFDKNGACACDAPATTTLLKNNGQIAQLCELHREIMIDVFKGVLDGVMDFGRSEEAKVGANHWFRINKISV